MKRFLILPSILLIFFTSCSGSTDVVGSIAGWTIPGVGTQFLFVNTNTGGAILNDSLGIVIQQTGQNNGGESNVISYLASYSTGSGIGYFIIQRNGDFWFAAELNKNLVVTKWDPFPTGSHDTLVGPVVDTSVVAGYHVWRTDTNYYLDSERISTPVGSFSTIRAESRVWQKLLDTNTGEVTITYDTLDYWFAPSVGYYVKETAKGANNWTSNLTKYFPH